MTMKRSRAYVALSVTGAFSATTCGFAALEMSASATPSATATPVAHRYGGTNREVTAIQIADANFGQGNQAGVAVLARDDNFPDALAGNALAAQKKGPLVGTPTGDLAGGAPGGLPKMSP